MQTPSQMRQDAIVVDREKYTYWSIGFFSIRVVYDLHTTYMELTTRVKLCHELCHRWVGIFGRVIETIHSSMLHCICTSKTHVELRTEGLTVSPSWSDHPPHRPRSAFGWLPSVGVSYELSKSGEHGLRLLERFVLYVNFSIRLACLHGGAECLGE